MRRSSAVLGSAAWLLAAPGVVAGVVPWLITRWQRPVPSWPILDILAVPLCLAGAIVLLHAFIVFAWHGRGTPSPAAPAERLVVRGAYRFVRNPMYLAVLAVVLGQALAFRSGPLLWYLAALIALFGAFVRLYEEPTLRAAYGDDYAAYAAAVPRWIPRLVPWSPPGRDGRTTAA